MVAVSLFQTKQIKYENKFKLLFVHVLTRYVRFDRVYLPQWPPPQWGYRLESGETWENARLGVSSHKITVRVLGIQGHMHIAVFTITRFPTIKRAATAHNHNVAVRRCEPQKHPTPCRIGTHVIRGWCFFLVQLWLQTS